MCPNTKMTVTLSETLKNLTVSFWLVRIDFWLKSDKSTPFTTPWRSISSPNDGDVMNTRGPEKQGD